MKTFPKTTMILLGLIIIASAACKSSKNTPVLPTNTVPASIESKTQNLAEFLEMQGFEVKRGSFFLFGIPECHYAIEVMGTCYGNNPVAPYIMPALPPWTDEFVDPATKNAFGLMPEGLNSIYRIDPREAIVILAKMPPPAAYMGLQTYEFTRPGTINTSDPIYLWLGQFSETIQKVFFDYSPNPKRLKIFASIGNSNNNVVVERQSGGSFGEERFFIITPDQYMERQMKRALQAAGVQDVKDIFVEPISPVLQIGMGEEAYDFTTFMRYAMPQVPADGDDWRTNLPMTVLRVRDKNTSREVEDYPLQVLETRTAADEQYLAADLGNLVQAVRDFWVQDGETPMIIDLQTQLDMVGPHCDPRGMDCLGDSQDTAYIGTLMSYLDNNQVYVMMGPLATLTDNATYVNLSVYDSEWMFGVKSIDNTQLQDSATQFCAAGDCSLVNNIDKFYLVYFTRDCQGLGITQNCISLTEDMIGAGRAFKIAQRTYIKPGTERGPDSTQLLKPIMLQLDGSKM